MSVVVRRSTSPPEPILLPGNAQHRGDRSEQQDSFGFSDLLDSELLDRGGALVVLADGMGGHALGRTTSQIAVKTFLDGYARKSPDEPIPAALHRLLHDANAAVRELAEREGELDNAGTTLAAAVIHQQELHWIAVGDSRIYCYHQGQITPLTTDHVYARDLEREVAVGTLSVAEAAAHPDREALTSFLGMPVLDEIESNLRPVPLQSGDRVLLCSDGLYRNLSATDLAEELARSQPQAAAEALLGRALARPQPRQDNVTVVILGLGGAVSHSARSRRYRRWLAAILVGGLLTGIGAAAGWWFGHTRQEPSPTPAATPAPVIAPPATGPVPTPSPPATPDRASSPTESNDSSAPAIPIEKPPPATASPPPTPKDQPATRPKPPLPAGNGTRT